MAIDEHQFRHRCRICVGHHRDYYTRVNGFEMTAVSSPEPSTLVLLGTALLGLLAYAWRKRKGLMI